MYSDELNKEDLMNEINQVWGNADFGGMDKLDVVKLGLLKCASGYSQGHTSTCILYELAMTTKSYELTPKGKAWLWEFFSFRPNF